MMGADRHGDLPGSPRIGLPGKTDKIEFERFEAKAMKEINSQVKTRIRILRTVPILLARITLQP